ncbi:MAG: L-serine/L-threonine ammonia-lyase, partial [Gammaproteobacteria bacterium]
MNKSTKPLHTNTPLILSSPLSTKDRNVWLKMEALQPAGSFKNRGIGVACQHYVANGAKRLISSSGGNAGIATAYCGMMLGVPVSVVVPKNAPETVIAAMRRFGADVQIHGALWPEAHQKALELVNETNVLIHPFDDPLIWPGHATLIDEVVAANCIPDAVVHSVGGGGLLCGVTQGLKRNNLAAVPVVAVETSGAASMNAAMRKGELVTLDSIDTIANTLGAKRVAEAAFEASQEFNVSSVVVSDKQALNACYRFLDDHRVMVEPSCGAALAAIYDDVTELQDKANILVVVCG